MTKVLDRLGFFAEEQADQVFGAEAFAGAHDCRHCLLRRDSAVDHRDSTGADVAIPTGRRNGLAEVAKQGLAPATRGFAERYQGVEAQPVDPLLVVRSGAFLDLAAAQTDVAGAEEGQRIGRQAVATGTADLLVVALDVVWHVGVANETYIRFV